MGKHLHAYAKMRAKTSGAAPFGIVISKMKKGEPLLKSGSPFSLNLSSIISQIHQAVSRLF
jgi:hypothetical protein